MSLSHLPAFLANAFADLAHWLDRRSAARAAPAAATASSSPGAAAPSPPGSAPPASPTTSARPTSPSAPPAAASTTWPSPPCSAVTPLLDPGRLLLAIDDTPTPRYGPQVEGAASTTTPRPGPAGEKYVYGHVWVTLAALADHPDWGTLALPLQAQLYVREADLRQAAPGAAARLPHQAGAGRRAAALAEAVGRTTASSERWVVVDGGYAKKPFLQAGRPSRATSSSAGCARTRRCGRCPSRKPAGAARAAGDVRQGAAVAWPSGPGRRAAGRRSSACSTARR